MITISCIILFCFNFVHTISIDDNNRIISTPLYSTQHAVSSHSQSVLRSQDGKSVMSSYSKAVDTPHSSVRKYDTRVTNDAAPAPTAPADLVYSHLPIFTSYEHKPITYILPHYGNSKLAHHVPHLVPHYVYNAAHRTLHPLVYHTSPSTYHLTSQISHLPDTSSVSHITFDAFDGTHTHYVH